MVENPSTTERKKRQSKARRAGQVVARGEGKWLVRLFLGRDDSTGQRRYYNKTIRGAKKDAEKHLRELLRRHDCGETIEPTRDLAASFFNRWLETTVKPRIRPRSFEVYKQAVDLYLLPEFGRRRLSDIRPIDLQSFYSKLRDRGLSATTIRTIHAIASNAFKQAVPWQMIRQNPAALVDLPRIEKREMQSLTAAEARDFLKATEGGSYHPLFVFLLASGCRPGEAFGLKWSDIDWQAGTATIQRALYWKQGRQGWEITEPKTAKSRRTIPLGAFVVKTLADWKRRQAEDRLRAEIGPGERIGEMRPNLNQTTAEWYTQRSPQLGTHAPKRAFGGE